LINAELVIDKNMTINGPGPNTVTISGSFSYPSFRIFHVMSGHTATIQGLTITGGSVGFGEVGGGILNDHATLMLSDCTVEFNASADAGGGICNDGSNGSATMTIVNSTVSGNRSPFGGGVLNEANEGNATLAIVNSIVSDNASTGGSPPLNLGAQAALARLRR
jgi:hypothetical protein